MVRFEDALSAWQAGRLRDAIELFNSLAANTLNHNEKAAVLVNVVRCYSDLGSVSDAKRTLTQIRQLGPDDAVVRANADFAAACVSAQGGEYEQAVLQYRTLLKDFRDLLSDPEYRDFYEDIKQRLGICLAHLREYRDASDILTIAKEFKNIQPGDLQRIHLYLGICYAQLGEPQLAKQEFLNVLAFRFGNGVEAQAHYNLGVLYFLDGGFAQAKRQLESVFEVSEGEVSVDLRKDVYRQLSRVYKYLGDDENMKRYARLGED